MADETENNTENDKENENEKETEDSTEETMENNTENDVGSSAQNEGDVQNVDDVGIGDAPAFPEFHTEEGIVGLADYDERESLGLNGDVTAVYNVPVQISAVLGRATMPVSQLLKLGRGAVVELDRRVGESIDIFVNNRLVARGEVVVIDERLGITMTEIIKGNS